jgi:hypothetical protein
MNWTPDEDKRLLELKAGRKHVAVISKALKRTEGSVTARLAILKKLANRQIVPAGHAVTDAQSD